jgi:hypothetical protein
MDKEKIESTKASLDTHKHYMETLERIQNMLKKNKISVKKVKLFLFNFIFIIILLLEIVELKI